MSVRAGRLASRVMIQEDRGTAADAHGNTVPDWRTVGTVWAEVVPLSGREYLQAQQINADVQYRVTLRRDSLSERLTARHRLASGSTYYYLEPPLFGVSEITALARVKE